MLLTGTSEQKQSVTVELYSEFKDDSVSGGSERSSNHIETLQKYLEHL